MKKICDHIREVKDEICSAMDYAERYVIYKTDKPQWAQAYGEMAKQEIAHAEHLITIGQEFINGLVWVSEDDKDAWEKVKGKYAEKSGIVKMMLGK